jgi:hypothetical protein
LLALLHRIRGYGLMQTGDYDGAEQCFDESIRVARAEGAGYELALSLDGRAKLRSRSGSRDRTDAHEAAELFESLGVVSVPRVPLPAVGSG